MRPKEQAIAFVRSLPDDMSFDDIAEALQIWADSGCDEQQYSEAEAAEIKSALGAAREDIAAGRYKTHEEVVQLFREWAKEWNTK
jgi:hypothetical protein